MSTELVERLKPSYAADKAAIEAAVQLRGKYPRLTESLNAAIVANNALKSEAVAELTALTAKVALLTEALKPFAELADKHHSGFTDDAFAIPLVTVGHLRAARALSEPDKEGT